MPERNDLPSKPTEPSIEDFLGEPTESLPDWRWLWEGDHPFPIQSDRARFGGLVVWLKKLLRPLVRSPQADLWDRQRLFNLVLLSHLENNAKRIDALGQDLQKVQTEILKDLRGVQNEVVEDLAKINADLQELDQSFAAFKRDGLKDLARQTDALFSLLDQKIDRAGR